MVLMRFSPIVPTGVTHERAGTPSTRTVHAPQSATPQPNFVPVRPSTSRSTQSTGVSASTSTACAVPLMFSVNPMSPKVAGCGSRNNWTNVSTRPTYREAPYTVADLYQGVDHASDRCHVESPHLGKRHDASSFRCRALVDVAGRLSTCVGAESVARHQPVRAHRVEGPGRVREWRSHRAGTNAGRLSLDRHG